MKKLLHCGFIWSHQTAYLHSIEYKNPLKVHDSHFKKYCAKNVVFHFCPQTHSCDKWCASKICDSPSLTGVPKWTAATVVGWRLGFYTNTNYNENRSQTEVTYNTVSYVSHAEVLPHLIKSFGNAIDPNGKVGSWAFFPAIY